MSFSKNVSLEEEVVIKSSPIVKEQFDENWSKFINFCIKKTLSEVDKK